jgi:uncharacterized protein with HEPN domain
MKKDKNLDNQLRLEHIQHAIEVIETCVKGATLESFCSDKMLIHAVLFNFTVMGEAIVHVESSILEKYKYPWHSVRAFRNLIAHESYNIKMEMVWKIIEKDLHEVKVVISEILNREF